MGGQNLGMRVLELWRYPVKSLQGERIERSEVGAHGLAGDRSWALLDRSTGLTLTARRVPELLFATGVLTDAGAVIRLPDGSATADDAELSAWLDRDVALVPASAERAGTYEIAEDAEDEAGSPWRSWVGPTGSFHDSTRTMVSIIGQDTLRGWPVRRFRPNVVVEGGDEDGLVGSRVVGSGVGGAGTTGPVLDVVKQIDRCVMVTRPQPDGIERDLDVLRTVNRDRATFLGVGAMVARDGHLAVGDDLTIR